MGEFFQNLMEWYEKSYYTEPLIIIVLLIGAVIGIMSPRKEKVNVYFTLYFLVGLIYFILANNLILLKLFTPVLRRAIEESVNVVFTFLESLAFSTFFYNCLKKNNFKCFSKLSLKIITVVCLLFFIRFAFPGFSPYKILQFSYFVTTAELIFLAILCLLYFYEFLLTIPKNNLSNRTTFSIVTATFFYSLVIIPFFLLANEMKNSGDKNLYNVLYTCHYVLFIIMLIAIIKGISISNRINS